MTALLFLALYTALMVGATLIFARKGDGKEDFYVGNHKLGTVSSAMSIAATWIWAPALFTSAEKAYTNGAPGLFWFLVPNVLCLLFFIPFARRIRKEMPDGITLSGYMGQKYHSGTVKGVYLFQLGALCILSTSVQLLAGGKILATVTGYPLWVMTFILAAIAFSYSAISGIRASILTDVLQMLFMLASCALFVPLALRLNGGMDAIKLSGITGEYTSLFGEKGMEVFLGFGLPTAIGLIAGPFGDQCFWQRAFSVREDKIGKAFSLGALFFFLVPFSMGLLGFIAAGTGFIPADKSMVNFELIKAILPSWVVIPFMFMLISGLLSTVDSNLCAIASLTTDVGKRNTKAKGIKAMVALLAVSILISNIPGLTVTHMFLFYGTFRAATMLPTMLTLKGVKLKARGVTSGIITSLCVGLPVFAYGNMKNIAVYKTTGSLLTVALSGIIAVIVSRHKGTEAVKA